MVTRCECSAPGFCARHRCHKTSHWFRLCLTRQDYFEAWERGCGPGQQDGCRPALTIAVVVICHNYGRFLAEALESVLTQSLRPNEVLVVDDSSDDETPEIAAGFAARGVRYVKTDVRNVHGARSIGFRETTADVLCFLDADDRLPVDYLASGLTEFCDHDVAVVYSDVEFFGDKSGRSHYADRYDARLLQRDNYIHAGSLVRRDALAMCGVFDCRIDPQMTQGDWFLWRRTLTRGWTARKQRALYQYRQHGANWTVWMRQNRTTEGYFGYAGLAHEEVTLFVPLSGRKACWPQMRAFLKRQTWPHSQVRLILFDTSRSVEFSGGVRQWIGNCDYADVRHVNCGVGASGLADADRRDPDVRTAVVAAMQQIYSRMAQMVETEYVWLLEDDILPPDDVCERLLRGFERDTVSVAAPYLSRFRGDFVVWDAQGNHFAERGSGLEPIAGNGFGCTIVRRSVLAASAFAKNGRVDDFDRAFYTRLQRERCSVKVDWSIVCEHGLRNEADVAGVK